MCLIAYQPPGSAAFAPSVLRNGWEENPDGAGYMFVADGKLVVRKPFYKLRELRKAYMEDHAAHGAASAFVLHFRWATHGSKAEGNVHPHVVADETVGIVHNGIMPGFAPPKKWDQSDTAMFCNTVLNLRSAADIMSDAMATWLETWIGRNKLVFMDSTGTVRIVNENMGVWDGEYWYSNSSYDDAGYGKWTTPGYVHGGTTGGVDRGLTFDSFDGVRQHLRNMERQESACNVKGEMSLFTRPDEWGDAEERWTDDYDDELAEEALATEAAYDDLPWEDVEDVQEGADGLSSYYDRRGELLFILDDAGNRLDDAHLEREALQQMDMAVARDGK